ncbi:MAG: His/Gly/Thr/Pro-type tRNA ligase C-terminal domain-containing protein, partial [Bacteroidota bacterium]
LGIYLPISVAPYQVIIVGLLDNEEVSSAAEKLYRDLRAAGIEVIYDNRDSKSASAGVKFKDAELIGIPIRITVSKRSLKNGGFELKMRKAEGKGDLIPQEEIVDMVEEKIKALWIELEERMN